MRTAWQIVGFSLLIAIAALPTVYWIFYGDSYCQPRQEERNLKPSADNQIGPNSGGSPQAGGFPERRGFFQGENQKPYGAGSSSRGERNSRVVELLCQAKLTDLLIALFTYCLLVVGAFQGWFLLDAGKAAVATAEAASRQAHAAVASELPVIAFVGQKLIKYDLLDLAIADPVPPGVLTPGIYRALVEIRNAGRTNASLLRYSIRWLVAPELPPEPSYDHMGVTNNVIPPNSGLWIHYPREPIIIQEAERRAIDENFAHLWIYGFLAYGDFMGEVTSIGFSYRWEIFPEEGHQPRGLIPDGPSPYRYQKRTQRNTWRPA